MKKIITIVCICLMASCIVKAQIPAWTQTAHPSALQVNGVAFSNNGSKVISGTNCHPSKVRLYDVTNGNILWDYTVDTSFYCLMGIGFSSNGKHFAAIEEMGNVLVFDNVPAIPVLIDTVVMGTMYAFSIDFAPNSYKMAVGGSNGKLQTYVVSNGLQSFNVNAHTSWVTAVNYSPDNSKIASGGSDTKVKVWDTTGVLLNTLSSHTDDISSVKFTKDNARLLSASLDDKIKVWSVSTGSLIQTISPSVSDVLGIDISSDNNHFVSVSADKVIRIYNLNTYVLEASFGLTTSGTPLCVSWSQNDPNKIAVGYSNGTVTLYDIGGVLSVNDNDLNSFNINVYPNPFIDEITVRFPQNTVSLIEIYDVSGKLLSSQPVTENKSDFAVDTKELKYSGTYFVSLKTKESHVIKKIIKTKSN